MKKLVFVEKNIKDLTRKLIRDKILKKDCEKKIETKREIFCEASNQGICDHDGYNKANKVSKVIYNLK